MTLTLLSIWDPLERFLQRSAELLPVLLAVFVVLVAGVALAWLLEAGVRGLLRALRFDRVVQRRSIADALRRTSMRLPPSALVGQLVRWVMVVLTLLAALSILSAEATDVVLAEMVKYLPRLAAGLLILILGYAVSTFVARSVLIWAVNSRLHGARWLSAGVRVVVGVFFLTIALENLGFGRDIALVVLAILLGGSVLAFALAFGLAGRDLARESLERATHEAREEDRDTLSHL